VACIKLCGLQ